MSFWGATNQQVILQSDFTYSIKPDRVAVVVPPKLNPPSKVYELTWDAPQADTVKVTQKLLVEISCTNVLASAAKLPYPKEVQEFYASALATTEDINPDNPKLEAVAKLILAKSKYAVDAMELAAIWVDENIKFKSMANGKSDTILADGLGNCYGMSKVACALLRKMGIPAETVNAKFIEGSGHVFIEAYLPDAGWVFYDPSNANHGFKCCDVLMTAGWGFLTFQGEDRQMQQGAFLDVKDVRPYEEPQLAQTPIRPSPKDKTIADAQDGEGPASAAVHAGGRSVAGTRQGRLQGGPRPVGRDSAGRQGRRQEAGVSAAAFQGPITAPFAAVRSCRFAPRAGGWRGRRAGGPACRSRGSGGCRGG
jgi:hypothetical protein